MSDDLVAWLRAQVDEDERVARAAADRGHGQWKAEANYDGGYVLDGVGDIVVYDEGRPWTAEAAHIARHDPARVLAEVAAKRRIIDRLSDAAPHSVIAGQAQREDFRNGWQFALWDVVRDLASVYAGRPGWREEWAADEEVPS